MWALKAQSQGFPDGFPGKESTCQGRRWVRSLIQEDPTCRGAMKAMCHMPQLLTLHLEPGSRTTEAHAP